MGIQEHKYLDETWLRTEYIEKGRTIKSICDEFGVAHQSVERYLKKFGIRKQRIEKMPTPDEIRDLHINKGYGISKIASMYPGVGESTILGMMEGNGIEHLSAGQLHTIWWKNPENQRVMSEQRLQWWQDEDYRSRVMAHLTDKEAITDRAIKLSASYQGISVDEWGGFLTTEQTRIRGSKEYAKWRKAVFKRDNYTCQCCGARSRAGHPVISHVHHLENFAHNEGLRFDIDNGVTLCRGCHDIRVEGSFHNLYGIHGNTKQQFDEYLFIRHLK